MRVLVSTQHHFVRTPDGAVHSTTGGREYRFWHRYLTVFEEVLVLARVAPEDSPPLSDSVASGPGVRFIDLPEYIGPAQYLCRFEKIKQGIRSICADESAFILRVPGTIGDLAWQELRKRNHPYAIEVVGDPYDVFSPGSVRHPLRPFFRWWFPRQLRRQCNEACAVAYVTQWALQRRYPVMSGSLTMSYSDVELPEEAFSVARPVCPGKHSFTLITIGSLAQLYKAPDVLIEAVAICVQAGLDLRLVLVGDGKYRSGLEIQAALSLGERVRFLGQLPAGDAVRAQLDLADLFVLPSRVEGLPRAMIEAMARGLPCIGSTIGGIPELLPPEDLVPPGDVTALASKIREVVGDPDRMERMSRRNLEKAREYHEGILRKRRDKFYRYVRERTEEWLKNQGQ